MAGLSLIQEYSSDTDEEDEKCNNENTANDVNKLNIKLPLPQSILSLKGVVHHEEIMDDPTKHEGRIRSFKHERGNWATLVYIDYTPSKDMLFWIKNAFTEVENVTNLFEEFHVSLTRTLILKFHWIDSFIGAVKNIADYHQSFVMELSNIKIFCNEDTTRTFIGITVENTNDSLQRLTHTLDKLLSEYQLPIFYKDASYHISLFWCLGDQRKTLEDMLASLNSKLHNFLIDQPEERYIQVDSLKCKIGNKLYNLKLK